MPTVFGAILSILLLIVTLIYAIQKTQIMFTKKGVDVIEVTSVNHFDDQYVVTASQGLQVAFAVIPSDFSQLDPSYGEIKF